MSDKFSKAREDIKEAIKCMSALKSWIFCEKLFVLDCVQYLTERFLNVKPKGKESEDQRNKNMQPVRSAGKQIAGAKRGRICSWGQAWENTEPYSSAGKCKAGAKRGKTHSWSQARENMQLMPSAEKHEAVFKRGKIWSRSQARENMQLRPSAGKHEAVFKRGKIWSQSQARVTHSSGSARETCSQKICS